jgi:hypothetical protein
MKKSYIVNPYVSRKKLTFCFILSHHPVACNADREVDYKRPF